MQDTLTRIENLGKYFSEINTSPVINNQFAFFIISATRYHHFPSISTLAILHCLSAPYNAFCGHVSCHLTKDTECNTDICPDNAMASNTSFHFLQPDWTDDGRHYIVLVHMRNYYVPGNVFQDINDQRYHCQEIIVCHKILISNVPHFSHMLGNKRPRYK